MIIGPNGAGKSTFLRTISGIDKDSIRNVDINQRKDIPTDSLNHMVQQTYLFDLSVEENLRLGGKGIESLDEKVEELLVKLDLLTLRKEKCRNLSGGEAQKVAFARTILSEKPLILLDEPTSAMDVKATKRCEELIVELNRKCGITFLMTTHNPSQALRIGHQILIMDQGKIVEAGTPEHIQNETLDPAAQSYLENWRVAHA
ncbi:MAG TPA: hypothetical protein DCP62_01850 [Erysipelotrichaceae bacterium]|nr:hypothetical protein [Erysipelotrichaceae bacterium]